MAGSTHAPPCTRAPGRPPALADIWAADWIGNPPLRAYFNGPNVIFRDGFESGNRSKWSSSHP